MLRSGRLVALVCLSLLPACQAAGEALKSLGAELAQAPLSEETVVAGLKEALSVGTQRAADTLSRPGGYAQNDALRIALPESFDKVASALRAIGLGGQLDLLEQKMNAAAETAAAQVAPVFLDGIRQMSFEDARRILTSDSRTAATEFFRSKTLPKLTEMYLPVVRGQLDQVGVVRQFNELMQTYRQIPFAPKVDVSLEGYVTERALDGLFTALGEVEADIRTNPLARTTELLQRVFAK